ncbi:MAG: cyclase family protein [Acidobacteriota bacterium]
MSHSYGEETLYWPTDTQGFLHDELAYGPSGSGYFYSAYSLCTAEHGGTHLDAPIHFAEGGATLDAVGFDSLIAPAVVLDVTTASELDRDYRLTLEDISAWEAEHGRIPAGTAVLLRTGWSDRWPLASAYLGDDTPGDASNLHFPSFGEASARLLVEERGVKLLGVDTASIDYGPSEDFIVHQVASARGVPALENATNLDRLPPTGAWLVALPMKISGGSGGPVRAVALLP